MKVNFEFFYGVKGEHILLDLENRLQFFASLYQVDKNPQLGMWLLYGTIVVLCILAYKLGFSHKLPLLKSLVVYLFLFLGCTILTILGVGLPIAEGLFVIVLVLFIYRVRRKFENTGNVTKEEV